MECLFCNIANGRVPSFKVWENEDFFVFLDIAPINPGHVLLVPKKHFNDVFIMPQPLYAKMFEAAKYVAKILKKATSAKRIGLAVEGFGVLHAHLHLVPVNSGNEINPERAKAVSENELKNMQRLLKMYFKES